MIDLLCFGFGGLVLADFEFEFLARSIQLRFQGFDFQFYKLNSF